MPGVRIDVACEACARATKEMTGTITWLRTTEKPVLCSECRLRRNREYALEYQRILTVTRWAKGNAR